MSVEDKFNYLLNRYKKMPDSFKSLLTYSFRVLPWSYYLGKNYKNFKKAIETIENFDEYKIAEYQFNQLIFTLKHAYETVPYYEQKFNEYGEWYARIRGDYIGENCVKDTIANISKAKKHLEWKPSVKIVNGIKRCICWFYSYSYIEIC